MGREIVKIILVLAAIFCMSSMRTNAGEEADMYEIHCEQADGKNGYYTKPVDIAILHHGETSVTKYRLEFPSGKKENGTLGDGEDIAIFRADLFEEGTHYLEVWLEGEDGKMVDGTRRWEEIKIDTKPPEGGIQFLYENGEESVCSSKEVRVELKASDSMSGVEKIYYQIGDEPYQPLNGANVFVTVPLGSAGKITAYATDKAGNKSELSYSKEIICENSAPEITGELPNGFDAWYNREMIADIYVREKEISSGIKTIFCSFNGAEMYKKTYGKGEKIQETCSVPIKQAGELLVKAEDWAGNEMVWRKRILYDEKSPQIEIKGVENHAIADSERKITCRVTDEQRVAFLRGNIAWSTPNGEKKSRVIENWKKDDGKYQVSEVLREEGKYEIFVEAADQSGNRSEKRIQVIIDKENPVIRGLEKLHGKHLRFFEWKQEISEMAEDFTTYTYRIYLDGMSCEKNQRYTKEGKHTLELAVRDAANHEAKAKAEFVIDHTAPEIHFRGTADKKAYEKGEEMIISVNDENDFLTYVSVNGRTQKLEGEKRKFSYIFQDTGNCHISVQAKDLAGNETAKEMEFEVLERKSFFEKIVEGNLKKEKKEKINKTETAEMERKDIEKNERNRWKLIAVCVAGIVGIGIWNQKRCPKREDAE